MIDNRPPFEGLKGKDPGELFSGLRSPCYIIDEAQIRKNCEILKAVADKSGAKILLAQKAFSNFDLYPLMSQYLAGTEASGLYEARLGAECMQGREVHVFCGAYRDDEFEELLKYADHVVFNSVNQLKKFGKRAKGAGKSVGLRINPECSTQEGHAIYDPCAPMSRLGVTRAVFDDEMSNELLSLLDGLHFHTLCEQNSDDLALTLTAVEEKFGDLLPRMKWLNMGGGHHITRADYDRELLCRLIGNVKAKYNNVEVYLEPGEACALNAGYLVSSVLDVVRNGDGRIAILDSSAACHMPDVIEMPYTPPLYGTCEEGFSYRLGGPTCLSGDIIGDFILAHELKEGDLLAFGDMAIYTTCKNNTFNGMPLPDIYLMREDGEFVRLTAFGYEDFKGRLGAGDRGL